MADRPSRIAKFYTPDDDGFKRVPRQEGIMTAFNRRQAAGLFAGALLGSAADRAAAQGVRWSAGTERPKTSAPANATDCHHHIFDKRYPLATGAPALEDASIEDYRLLQRRLGTKRHVFVQSSIYGTDNSIVVDALKEFGPEARGIAVVDTSVTDAELRRLHDAGIRGIRFVLIRGNATNVGMLKPLSQRVNELGWHVDIHAPGDQIAGIADELAALASPVVFDHLGRIPQPAGATHPAFKVINSLLDKGQTWIKISGAYQDSKIGPPTYSDTSALAAAFIKRWPERIIWGTDWPHPSTKNKPDDALLFDLVAAQAPDENTRHRILVENPAELFGFPKA
jgi:predicted TIM-barrel fold metal-dependent hydrolase